MITAAEIAKELGADVYRVRYRLDQMRADDTVPWEKHGQTFIYNEKAVQIVKEALCNTKQETE